ncbi:MAG: nitroreductase family protein [Paludibacteraceae bacterium]|nr:nitroreductase family protein [Paludibacteraceae bacterium]
MDFINELLRNRRSIRRFKETKIENEKIELLKKAILMSPSGKRFNEWEFIFIDDKNILDQLSYCKEHGSELLRNAPLGIVVIADKNKSDIVIEDCSIASIIAQLAAESIGLGSCWVQCRLRKTTDGKDSEDVVREILNIPDNYFVQSIIAIGYKDQDRKPFEDANLQWEKIHTNTF